MEDDKIISLVKHYVERTNIKELTKFCNWHEPITKEEAINHIVKNRDFAYYIAEQELIKIEMDYNFYKR